MGIFSRKQSAERLAELNVVAEVDDLCQQYAFAEHEEWMERLMENIEMEGMPTFPKDVDDRDFSEPDTYFYPDTNDPNHSDPFDNLL